MKRLRKLISLFILTSLVIIVSVSCEKFNLDFGLNEEIEVAFNKKVSVVDGDNKLEIKFSKLIEESRCPPGASCIWAGRVIVEMEINESEEISLGIPDIVDSVSSEAIFDDYKISLVGVEFGRDANYGNEKKYSVRIKVEEK